MRLIKVGDYTKHKRNVGIKFTDDGEAKVRFKKLRLQHIVVVRNPDKKVLIVDSEEDVLLLTPGKIQQRVLHRWRQNTRYVGTRLGVNGKFFPEAGVHDFDISVDSAIRDVGVYRTFQAANVAAGPDSRPTRSPLHSTTRTQPNV